MTVHQTNQGTSQAANPARTTRKARTLYASLPIVAAALGKKFGVQVIVSGNEMKTNGKCIWVPAFDPDEPELCDVAYGVIAHEAGGHIQHTDFNVIARTYGQPLRKELLNVIEDVRIEAALAVDYPGTRKTIAKVIDYLIRRGEMSAVKEEEHPADILSGYCLLRLRSDVLGQKALEPFADASEAVAAKTFPAGAMVRLHALLAEVKNLESTAEALDLVDLILTMLKQEEEKARQQPPQPPQQQQQGGQQGQDQDQNAQQQQGGAGSGSDEDDAQDDDSGSDADGNGQGGSGKSKDSNSKDDDATDGEGDDADGEGGDDGEDQDSGSQSGSGSDDADDGQSGDGEDDNGGQGSDQDGDAEDTDDDGQSGDGEGDDDGDDGSGSGSDSGDDADGNGQSGDGEGDDDGDDGQGSGQGDGQDGNQGSKSSGSDADGGDSSGSDQGGDYDPNGADAIAKALSASADQVGSKDLFKQAAADLTQSAGHAPPHSRVPAMAQPQTVQANPLIGQGIISRVRTTSGRVRAQLLGLVQASRREEEITRRRGRAVDGRKISRIITGDTRVFTQRTDTRAPNAAIHILVDRSGSMDTRTAVSGGASRNRLDVAIDSAVALAVALEAIAGVNPAITAFPASRNDYDQDLSRAIGVLPLLKHGQKVRQAVPNFAIAPAGGTPLGEAMWYAAAQLVNTTKEERKLLLVITDGEPNNAPQVIDMVNRCQASGIETIGIGIQLDRVRQLFPTSVVIQDIGELRSALFEITRKALTAAAA